MTNSDIIENIEIPAKFDLHYLRKILVRELTNFDFTFDSYFKRIEIPIPEVNIVKWLGQQSYKNKIYWSERSRDFETGGIGIADVITSHQFQNYQKSISLIYNHLNGANKFLRYYGGFQFNQNEISDELWKNFGKFYFSVPLFEIFRSEDDFYFAINIKADQEVSVAEKIDAILQQFNRIKFSKKYEFPKSNDFLSREDFPDAADWATILRSVLKSIKSNDIDKVVMARKVILKFCDRINIFSLLHKLKKINPFATHFCFQVDNDIAFLGGTPELLYQRNNGSIYSEAIAGTRPRGKTEFDDSVLERELIDSDKERREHAFVINSVQESLDKLCKDVICSKEISVIKLRRLQHLYSKFHGKLKNKISDVEILSELHPTPAVGGYPQKEALEQIENIEPFRRGWYAGPVGWIGSNSAEFAVAIRSGLINGKNLALYSGGGIVDGSDINSEWLEIENKIGNFLKALGLNGK